MTKRIECQSCVYWSSTNYERAHVAAKSADATPQLGQCRRHAPTMQRTDQGLRGIWPTTHALQWCGEHADVVHESDPA